MTVTEPTFTKQACLTTFCREHLYRISQKFTNRFTHW